MSKELLAGLRIGRSSLLMLNTALRKSLGDWARILPYLDKFTSKEELELVSSINYLLGKDVELTPPLKASLAVDFVESEKELLISEEELLTLGVGHGKEEEKE